MKHDIIERIIKKLDQYEDMNMYACELAYTLFEGENYDGSCTYSTYAAEEWIKENFDDIAEVWEELSFQFDNEYLVKYNMFENPERFMTLIVIESASTILSRCDFISDNWNDKITLDAKSIKNITNDLYNLDNGLGIYA